MEKSAQDKLTLEDVELFGGTKKDLELLRGVDDSDREDLAFSDDEVDDKSRDEIKSFIEKLGLRTEKSSNTASVKGDIKRTKPKKTVNTRAEVTGDDGTSSIMLDKSLLSLSVKAYKKMLYSMGSDQPLLEKSDSTGPSDLASPQALQHLTQVGKGLMQSEVTLYEKVRQKKKSSGDLKWLKTVLSSGTLSDKMAARTLLIQESPLHTLSSLDSLLAMASKKGKRECVFAIDTLKELWLSVFLPEDRKLKSLKQRPLHELVDSGQSLQLRHTKLLLWYYEDQVKTKYAQFLTALKGLLHDTVANIREKMLGHAFDLLFQKPEQERELLSQIVNKMGDPVRKIASKASMFILKLLNQHVNMKAVVASELERLLHRPNVRAKAQYYCVCCLNQFTIGGHEDALAAKLIDIYFTFFKLYVKRGELDAKMLGALLTGVNRAFPFLKGDIPNFEDHMQSLFTVVHVGPLATGIQSLLLLYQVMESRQAISGRYYQALYAKLMDPALKHSGKQGVFLNLLFKSLKSDPQVNRVKAFIKRILQVSIHHSPAFLCGCLYLISELLKLKTTLWSFILQPVANDTEHFVDTILPLEKSLTPELCNEEGERSDSDNHVVSPPNHVTRTGNNVTQAHQYRMMTRNPLYCGVECSCLWELSRVMTHYHPSVQAFANRIASGEYIEYKGDPLQDFTAMHFLDRFVYKNPKQKESDHGGSLMQKTPRLLFEESKKDIPVNSTQFVSLKADKVREDELFMHKYFVQKASLEIQSSKDTVSDLPFDEEDGLDFASEFEKSSQRQPKKRKERDESDSEGESIDGPIDSDIDDNDSLVGIHGDVGVVSGGNDATEAEMERMLLEQLSSDSDNDDERPQRKKKRSGDPGSSRLDLSSMFATADEFSHLLENEDGEQKNRSERHGSHKKQLLWEQNKSKHRKRNGRVNWQNRTNKKTFKGRKQNSK